MLFPSVHLRCILHASFAHALCAAWLVVFFVTSLLMFVLQVAHALHIPITLAAACCVVGPVPCVCTQVFSCGSTRLPRCTAALPMCQYIHAIRLHLHDALSCSLPACGFPANGFFSAAVAVPAASSLLHQSSPSSPPCPRLGALSSSLSSFLPLAAPALFCMLCVAEHSSAHAHALTLNLPLA